MLFDPFEEQFNLPTLVIDRSNDRGRDLKIVRQKNESLVDIGGIKADAPEQSRKFLCRVPTSQDDGLIAADAGGPINRMRLPAAKLKLLFGPKNKIRQCLVQTIEAEKIDVATIHDNKTSRLWND